MGLYKDYSQQKLFTDTALQNRLKGVREHAMFGVLLAGNATNIVTGIGGLLAGGDKSSNDVIGTAAVQDETDNFNETSGVKSKFNQAFNMFTKNPNATTAQALKDIFENNIKDNSSYHRQENSYNVIKARVEEQLKNPNKSA